MLGRTHQKKLKPKTGASFWIVGIAHGPPHGINQTFADRESQAHPAKRTGTGRIQLAEGFKEGATIGLRNTRSRVNHLNPWFSLSPSHPP
jgi:hypothetical protein